MQDELPGDQAAFQDAVEGLPVPLEHILSQVFQLYQAESPGELVRLLKERYREDATYVDPTLLARPRQEVGLTFYALQRLFCGCHIRGISTPEVLMVPAQHGAASMPGQQPGAPGQQSMLQVVVHSTQQLRFCRTTHISQQVLPESSTLPTTTCLLIDPRTGLVVRHEDSWQHRPSLCLPMAWRRINCVCTNAVYRLLGWGKVLQEAEQRGRWEE